MLTILAILLLIWCIGWALLHPIIIGKKIGFVLGYFIVGGAFLLLMVFIGAALINS